MVYVFPLALPAAFVPSLELLEAQAATTAVSAATAMMLPRFLNPTVLSFQPKLIGISAA
jgi:hypothetical protein